MSIELKPCPFCGGEAEMMGDQYRYVECHECGAGFTANHSYEFEDDAASNWNSRRFGQDKMKRIAEKKIEQLGGDVCGVLVRKDGRLAAVDEYGRVTWLQSGQGAEPVAVVELSDYIHLSGTSASQRKALKEVSEGSIQNLPVGTRIYTQPQPAQQDPDLQLIRERDYWEGKATELAEDVGKLLGVEVGEHSSHNCPVQNAIDAVFRATEYPAQQGGVPEWWKLVPVEPTAAMISAFEHAPCAENYTDAATWAWEAMLDAAPQPPQEGSGNE